MRGALALWIAIIAWPAHADDAAPQIDKGAAAQLFEQGRAALAAGNNDEACRKFEQSIRKDPRATGTLLNLALCNERQGKVASALALFIEAYDRADDAGQGEQKKAAEEHIGMLRPQVPILAISYAEHLMGEKLVVDDRVIAPDDKELPLDPGPHNIVLTAPGRLPYETTVVMKTATRVPLALPVLAVPQRGANPRRLAVKASLIGGGAALLASAGLGIYAWRTERAQYSGTTPHCGIAPDVEGKEVCDDAGVSAIARAKRVATVATVTGIVGGAAVALGVTLWLTGPKDSRIVPVATASGGSITLVGSF